MTCLHCALWGGHLAHDASFVKARAGFRLELGLGVLGGMLRSKVGVCGRLRDCR